MSIERDSDYNSPSFRGAESITMAEPSSKRHHQLDSPSTQAKFRNLPFSTHRPSNNISYDIINQMNFPSSISATKRKQF